MGGSDRRILGYVPPTHWYPWVAIDRRPQEKPFVWRIHPDRDFWQINTLWAQLDRVFDSVRASSGIRLGKVVERLSTKTSIDAILNRGRSILAAPLSLGLAYRGDICG